MSLHFVAGRAGTGKTYHMMEDIASRLKEGQGGQLIYLVPEQATFYMEKGLLEHCRTGGLMRAQVLSFQRLAWRVLQETGGAVKPVLDDTGKKLVLRRVIEKNKAKITAFARVLDKPGFLENLARVLDEFKVYGFTPELLGDTLSRLDPAETGDFQIKLGDLKLLYEDYGGYLNRDYLDTQDYLEKLAENLHKAGFLEDSEVWLDGFVGFTPREYDVIREMLLKAKRVNISVCLDCAHLQAKLPPTHTFYPPWETYQKLLGLAHEINCPVAEPVVLDYSGAHRFSGKKELAFLEQSFLQPYVGQVYQEQAQQRQEPLRHDGERSALKLVTAANRRAELEAAAREILGLCREKGFRYRDITVLIRDFSHYEYLLPAVFAAAGIPIFLDKKRPLRHHPLSELLRSALEVLISGWNYDSMFRYLKTDLAPLSRQEADILENYCLMYGIRGSRWHDGRPWTYRRRYTLGEEACDDASAVIDAELARINKAREKAAAALRRMEAAVQQARTVREYTTALFHLLTGLAVSGRLQSWSAGAKEKGLLEEARLHSQVWKEVIALFDQLVLLLGDQEMGLEEYAELIGSGLDSLELGLIPPGLDQVVIGSLDRTRNPNMKAVFVLGVNEGILPARCIETGLLSDEERKLLADMQIALAPTSEERLFAEQHLAYTAMTRAGDYLWVSCAQADDEGKALSPSLLYRQLEGLFPAAANSARIASVEPSGEDEADFIAGASSALGYLAAALRQAEEGKAISPIWWEVYNWYGRRLEWRRRLEAITGGLFRQNQEDNLPRQQIGQLFGKRLLTSISRLERFQACPFAHFLDFGLRAREREEFKLKAPDLGQLFHAALENIYRRLEEDGLSLAELTAQQARELAGRVVDELAPQLQNELLLSTSRYRYLTGKFKRSVVRAVLVLREHERRGSFRPVGLELSFGTGEGLPGLQFELADGSVMVLRGRIDRVDQAAGENGTYLRVIDYKSGRASRSLLEIYYGLKLQLLAYLNAVIKAAPRLVGGEAKPGGVFYFRIRDPFITEDGPVEDSVLEKKTLKELKLKGFLLRDEEAVRRMDGEIRGRSDLVPAALSEKGEFYKNSGSLFSEEEFAKIGAHVEKTIRAIGEEILAGKVAIRPYRFKGSSPCGYCAYKAVCRFDEGAKGQQYRVLPEREAAELWREMGEGEGGASDEQLDC